MVTFDDGVFDGYYFVGWLFFPEEHKMTPL